MTATNQITQYGEQRALQLLFGNATQTSAPTVYLALATADPGTTALTMAAVTEVSTSGTGYARQAFGPGTATSASPSVISNAGTITFGPFTSTVSGIIVAVLCDASTGTTANVIGVVNLATSRSPVSGDSLVAAAGAFTWSW